MKKFIFLFFVSVSFVQASFVKSIAEPDLVIDYKNIALEENKKYSIQNTKIDLVYDNSVLVFLPFGLWMEAGIKLYETIYNPMIEEMLKPVKAAKAAQIIMKLANNEKVTTKDIEFLTLNIKGKFKIPYKPYRPRLDIRTFEKDVYLNMVTMVQKDIVYKSYDIKKIDVMHKKGFNYFFMFPKDKKHLIINDILLPPVVYVEYNGVFYNYELDFKNKKAKLYNAQFSDLDKIRKIDKKEKKLWSKLTNTPKFVIERNFKKFATVYADFLKGDI